LDKKLDTLIDLRMNAELTEAEFVSKKERLGQEREGLRTSLERLERGTDNETNAVDSVLTFARDARSQFMNGDSDTRREIFSELGSNLFLTDRKFAVERNVWIHPLKRVAKEVRAIHARLEPQKTRAALDRLAVLYAQNPRMLSTS